MGIRSLNKFLKENCASSIKKRFIEDYTNESLVIDISIYMYKFKMEHKLDQKMYDMCSLFYKNNINAIFVFDGKATHMKEKELKKRKNVKEKAQKKCLELQNKLESVTDEEERDELEQEIISLKKQFIYITEKDRTCVKTIISGFGFTYIMAQGEADELCGYLCKKNDIYGCISDDMDMFPYGCKKVIRNLNIVNGFCLEYTFSDILNKLNMDETLFRQICVVTGTDYNETCGVKTFPIYKIMKDLLTFYKSNHTTLYEYYYPDNKIQESAKEIEKMFILDNIDDSSYHIIDHKKEIGLIKDQLEQSHFYFV